MTISDGGELRETYRPPAPRAAQKVLDRLDEHCRNFIALSPFCVLSTSNAAGQPDASPRGDPPGFVRVLDEGPCCCRTVPATTRWIPCKTSWRTPGWDCCSSCRG